MTSRRAAAVRFAAAFLLGLVVAGCSVGGESAKTTTSAGGDDETTTTAKLTTFAGAYLAVAADDVAAGKVQEALDVVDPRDLTKRGSRPLGAPLDDTQSSTRAHVVVDGDAAWVVRSSGEQSRLQRVAPASTSAELQIPSADATVAVGAGSVWVAAGNALLQLSPANGATVGQLGADQLPAGFRALHVAVAGGRVWVASDTGGFIVVDPQTLAWQPQEPLVTQCKPSPQTTDDFTANSRDVVWGLATVGAQLAAVVTTGCAPDATVVVADPTTGTRRSVALPASSYQELTALPAGDELLVGRIETNDLVPVRLDRGAGAPIALPDGTLAETCGADRARVVCTAGVDEVATVVLSGAPTVATDRLRGVEGAALAWAVT